MRKIGLVAMVALFIGSNCLASIRRIGFFGPPISGVDYSTFALAYTAAAAGDTILVFPGKVVSGTIAKKLIIIGVGDFLDTTTTPKGNAYMQAFPIIRFGNNVAFATNVTFSSGSAGSVIMGFDFGGSNLYVGENNITVRRNSFLVVYLNYNTNNDNLQVLENYKVSVLSYVNNGYSNTNLMISNNLITRITLTPSANGTVNFYNGLISNNNWVYCSFTDNSDGTFSGAFPIDLGRGSFWFENNIICSLRDSTSIANNVTYFTFLNTGNTLFNNNLALETSSNVTQQPSGYTPVSWSAANGNVTVPLAKADSILVGFPFIGTNSADGRHQLAPNSPALTAGVGGTPIGMYAGTSPYRLSLIPSIPTIFRLVNPQGNSSTGSTFQVAVSARANN